MNKVLPGTYINFVSAARASAMLSDRGIVACPLELDWGPDGEVFKVEPEDVITNSRKVFAHDYGDDEMLPLREIFKNARVLYTYKLNQATKASNDMAEALYGGSRGNDIMISVAQNVDNESAWDVSTILAGRVVDTQMVASSANLVPNDYVKFKTFDLAATAGTPLTGGDNGEASGGDYQDFLDKVEGNSFHILACPTDDDTTKDLFVQFTKRMRDEVGAKFQMVGHKLNKPDYEGCISIRNDSEGILNVENALAGVNATVGVSQVVDDTKYGLVYWVAGAEAACAVNASCTAKKYDGEYAMICNETQSELEDCINNGELVFHKNGEDYCILSDVNTFTSFTEDKNSDFSLNQVIRVLDQIANDVASTFANMFIGKVQNDASGRTSLWNEIVSLHDQLQQIRAIQNFDSEDIVVNAVDTDKRAVSETESVQPTCAMEKLYMTVTVE